MHRTAPHNSHQVHEVSDAKVVSSTVSKCLPHFLSLTFSWLVMSTSQAGNHTPRSNSAELVILPFWSDPKAWANCRISRQLSVLCRDPNSRWKAHCLQYSHLFIECESSSIQVWVPRCISKQHRRRNTKSQVTSWYPTDTQNTLFFFGNSVLINLAGLSQINH